MTPDAAWPNLPGYKTQFTADEHAAHTSPKGIPYPDDLAPKTDSRKAAKALMKFAHKPHLKMTKVSRTKSRPRRKRKP